MKVRTTLKSNLIFHGKVYVKNFMDEIEIPTNNVELVKYVKSNPALFPIIKPKPTTKRTVKATVKPEE